MARSLGSLTLELIAQVGGFVNGMHTAQRASATAATQIAADHSRLAGGLDKVYSGIGTVAGMAFKAVASGAIAAQTAIAATIIQGVQYADQIDEMSKRSGSSVENISAMGYAASQVGLTLEDLGTAHAKLSKSIVEAATPGSHMSEIFAAMGISATDANGKLKDTDTVMMEMADRFRLMDDNTAKAALSMETMGKSGTKFLEFMSLGSKGIQALKDEAAAMGVVLDENTTTAAADFGDKMAGVKLIVEALGARLAAELLPTIVDLVQKFADWASNTDNVATITGIARTGIEFLTSVIDWLSEAVSNSTSFLNGFVTFLQICGKFAIGVQSAIQGLTQKFIQLYSIATAAWKAVNGDFAGAKAAWDRGKAAGEQYQQIVNRAHKAGQEALALLDGTQANALQGMRKQTEEYKRQSAERAKIRAKETADAKAKLAAEQAAFAAQQAKITGVLTQPTGGGGGGKKTGVGGGKKSGGGGGGGGGMSDEAREAEQLEQKYQSLIERQQERLYMIGKEGEVAKLTYELEHGDLKKLTQAKKDELLATEKLIEAEQKRADLQKKYEDKIKDIEKTIYLLDHEGEAGQLAYELELGALKDLNEEQKQNLILKQQQADALRKLKEEQKKHDEEKKRIIEDTENMQFQISLLGKTREEQERLNFARDLGTHIEEEYGKKALETFETLQKQTIEMDRHVEIMDGMRDSFSSALSEWISGTKSFKDAFKDALDDINQRILKMITDRLMERLLGGFGSQAGGAAGGGWLNSLVSGLSGSGGGGSGGGGGFGSWLSAIFGGGKATGGLAAAGSAYRVNELGPEMLSVNGKDYLMMGAENGHITPAHRVGGGMQQVNNFTIQGRIDRRTENQIAMDVGRKAQTAQRRNS